MQKKILVVDDEKDVLDVLKERLQLSGFQVSLAGDGEECLRKADQEILSLRYGSGFDNAEIAESLDISPNAVAVRLHRALKRLKDVITDENI